MKVRKMRLLRTKYNISCPELGKAAGMSAQRISELEFSDGKVEPITEDKIQAAFLKVIACRTEHVCRLSNSFAKHENSLMEHVEELSYEL